MIHKMITCDIKTHNRLKAFCGAQGITMSAFVSYLINRELDYMDHLNEEEVVLNGREDA